MSFLSCFLTDSYKLGHMDQYPVGTTKIHANFTPRNVDYLQAKLAHAIESIPVVGLKYVFDTLIQEWNDNFFHLLWSDIEAGIVKGLSAGYGITRDSSFVSRFKDLYVLGYLPIKIVGVVEGGYVLPGHPIFTIENTKDEFFWLPNFLETWLSSVCWQSITSATIAQDYYKTISYFGRETGCPEAIWGLQAHDFSYRGMSSTQSAILSGLGHLFFFSGTDNIPAAIAVQKYYPADFLYNYGCSIPATEHSVMCCGSTIDGELSLFKKLITETYPKGLVSIVSDTWDYWKVLTEYTVTLKQDILSRGEEDGTFSKVVFRPDSGDPYLIICGDITAKEGSPERKGSIQVLWEVFGGTTNEKGYKVLNPKVGLIYGDSITPKLAYHILARLTELGFCTSCIVFGVGSYGYQYNTRDSLGFAMKTTGCCINGVYLPVFKKPKTGNGIKNSAKGFITFEYDESENVWSHQENLVPGGACSGYDYLKGYYVFR